MVVNGFSAFDFCIKRKRLSLNDFSRVNDWNSPNSRPSGTSVLFQNSLAIRKSCGEIFLKSLDIIISIGVFWNDWSSSQLYQSIFCSILSHHIWVGHSNKSNSTQSSQEIKELFFSSGNGSRIDSRNVPNISFLHKVFIEFLTPLVSVEHNVALVAWHLVDSILNWNWIFSMSIETFVASSLSFKENHLPNLMSSHLILLNYISTSYIGFTSIIQHASLENVTSKIKKNIKNIDPSFSKRLINFLWDLLVYQEKGLFAKFTSSSRLSIFMKYSQIMLVLFGNKKYWIKQGYLRYRTEYMHHKKEKKLQRVNVKG